MDPKNDVEEYLSKIDGVWHTNLKFDDIEYWNGTKDFPYVLDIENNPLPSASKFRHDVIYLQMGDKKTS